MKNKSNLINPYTYFFYLMALVARKINKRDSDYAFTSIILMSFCFCLNILTLVFMTDLYFKAPDDLFVGILFVASIIGFNYYFLIRNGKGIKIIKYYDRHYSERAHNPLGIFAVTLYVVFSFFVSGYVAYLTRK